MYYMFSIKKVNCLYFRSCQYMYVHIMYKRIMERERVRCRQINSTGMPEEGSNWAEA